LYRVLILIRVFFLRRYPEAVLRNPPPFGRKASSPFPIRGSFKLSRSPPFPLSRSGPSVLVTHPTPNTMTQKKNFPFFTNLFRFWGPTGTRPPFEKGQAQKPRRQRAKHLGRGGGKDGFKGVEGRGRFGYTGILLREIRKNARGSGADMGGGLAHAPEGPRRTKNVKTEKKPQQRFPPFACDRSRPFVFLFLRHAVRFDAALWGGLGGLGFFATKRGLSAWECFLGEVLGPLAGDSSTVLRGMGHIHSLPVSFFPGGSTSPSETFLFLLGVRERLYNLPGTWAGHGLGVHRGVAPTTFFSGGPG